MEKIGQAFAKFDRANFVPEQLRGSVSTDAPLPIGFGQTNSQPTTVGMMLKWLEVEPGNKIMDVGTGSGWTTALLSYLTGPKGKVYAVEKVPELVEFGRKNVEKAGVKNAEFHQAGKKLGLPEKAPFDRILVSAAARELPEEMLDQLKPGGKLVIPIKNSIFEIDKSESGAIKTTEHPGFVFVPLI